MVLDISLLFLYLSGTVLALFVGYFAYFLTKFNTGKKNGIPRIAASFPFGIVGNCYMETKSYSEFIASLYKKFTGYRYIEIFQTNFDTVVLRDPEAIKLVLVKDSSHFSGRGFDNQHSDEILATNLFTMSGPEKRKMRKKISPTFSSGKMKMMFKSVIDCGLELQEHTKELASRGELVNVVNLVGRFLTDVTMTCAFGVESNTLRNPNSEVLFMGLAFYKSLESSYLGTQILPKYRSIALPKFVTKFFLNLVKETVEYREKNDVKRNDFMDLLMQLKRNGVLDEDKDLTDKSSLQADEDAPDTRKLSLNEVASQAFAFFEAGFEPSSNVVSYCLYELAHRQEIQDKLRTEIKMVLSKHGGQVTYESIQEMEYLDKVFSETLRKHPVGPAITRECTSTYTLRGPDLKIREGAMVVVPVIGLHHDPIYYPEPERFDPERFTPEAKAARKPYTYFPFGDGPMMCVGMRFGIVQSKVAIIMLLLNSRVSLSYKTVTPSSAKRKPTPQTSMGLFLRLDPIST